MTQIKLEGLKKDLEKQLFFSILEGVRTSVMARLCGCIHTLIV